MISDRTRSPRARFVNRHGACSVPANNKERRNKMNETRMNETRMNETRMNETRMNEEGERDVVWRIGHE